MNSYDKYQLTARELYAADPCPPALTLFLYSAIGLAGLCVAAIVAAYF